MQRSNLDGHGFKKGISGNALGAGSVNRKREQTIRNLVMKINAEKIPPGFYKKIPKSAGIPPNCTMIEAVLIQAFNFALSGRGWAIEFIAERFLVVCHLVSNLSRGRCQARLFDFSIICLRVSLPP